jgi:hypothetical protein
MARHAISRETQVRQSKANRTGAVAAILCVLTLLNTGVACAQESTAQTFDIGPQSLSTALTAFARQSQQEILFSPELISRKSSSGVRGTLSPLAALKVLLNGSGLSITSTRNGAILIGDPASTSDASSNTVASTPLALAEVVVSAQSEARRAQLAAKIAAFVDEVTTSTPGDGGLGLVQWHEPVCPLVSGLSQAKGEFVLARISDIARAADVPLAGEHCRPNLYVYMTARPVQLLQERQKRDFAFTFGADQPPSVVDKFIGTPRAVRVWYVINGEYNSEVPPKNWTAQPVVLGRFHYAFARVFVVVDQRRLGAASLGQVADYIGLVGLAQLKQGARLDGAPSILSLFDKSQQAGPDSMSNWDRAFLKSLYGSDLPPVDPLELRFKEQRREIAQSMVKEIDQ